jgi:hypothetical protein
MKIGPILDMSSPQQQHPHACAVGMTGKLGQIVVDLVELVEFVQVLLKTW